MLYISSSFYKDLLVVILPGVDTYKVAECAIAIRPMGLHFFRCTMTKTHSKLKYVFKINYIYFVQNIF